MSTAIENARTESAEPETTPELLRLLGVQHNMVATQWRALLEWFADGDHPPGVKLWESLLANGYGLQLEQTITEFKRPIPYRRIATEYGSKASMLV